MRIYPSKGCEIYDQFFDQVKIVNKTLYYALYDKLFVADIRKTFSCIISKPKHKRAPVHKSRGTLRRTNTSRSTKKLDVKPEP